MPLADFQEQFPRLCARLTATKRDGRIAHAYLFVGDNDAILGRFATAWAQVVACPSPGPAGDACGACDCCRRLAAGTYPERRDLAPESKSRQILIDNVREFERHLALAADKGYRRLGVITAAEAMTQEAQNAFLKTLEEPAASTVLLLLSTQPRLLLPTIRSRCQIVSLLQNRKDYSDLIDKGLFAVLAPLRRHAGAAVGLRAAAGLAALFSQLMEEAKEAVPPAIDERWADAAAENPTLRKRLEEQREARVRADYYRRRAALEDGIEAWFLQRRLVAAGLAPELLPHPEILANLPREAAKKGVESPLEADETIGFLRELQRCLRTNVSETLAIEAFCLSVTEPPAKGTVR